MHFLAVVCVVGFACMLSWRVVDPMLGVMAGDLSVSYAEMALITSAYSFPFAIMQLVFGPIGDSLGKVRIIRLSLAMVALSQILMAVAPNYETVLIARGLGGAFAGGLTPVSLALVGDRIALNERQVALGRFLVATIMGQMAGAVAAGLLVEIIGWRLVFALVGVLVACACAATFVFLEEKKEPRPPISLGGTLRTYRSILTNSTALLILGALLCEGMLVLSLIPFVGDMIKAHGVSGAVGTGGALEAGIVIGAFAIGGVLFGLVVRRVLRRIGPWNMLRFGALLSGLAMIATALPVQWPVIAAMFLAAGFGFYMLHSTVQNRATELSPAARGAGMSLAAFCFYSGQGLGPAIGGAVAARFDYPALYVGVGLLTIAFGFAAALFIGRRVAP